MKRNLIAAALLAQAALVAPQAATATSVLTLDPFTGAAFKSVANSSTPRDAIQSGSMMHGFRLSRVQTNLAGFGQTATLQGRVNGPLIISNGYKSYHRVELVYGVDATGASSPMNFDLSPFDRLVLTLDGQNTVLNVNILMHSANGAVYSQAGKNVDVNILSHRVEFLFEDFTNPSGFDIRDVDYMTIVVQSASAVGGDDYAIVRLEAEGP